MTENRIRGRFQPGNKANPHGAPRGKRGTTRELRELIRKLAPTLIKKLSEAAEGGDVQAATALLDRAIPKLKPEGSPVPSDIDLSGSASDVTSKTLNAIARGEMSTATGLEIVRIATAVPANKPSDDFPMANLEELDAMWEQAVARCEQMRVDLIKERAKLNLTELKGSGGDGTS